MGDVALYCKAWLERQQKVCKKYMESKQKSQLGYSSECLKNITTGLMIIWHWRVYKLKPTICDWRRQRRLGLADLAASRCQEHWNHQWLLLLQTWLQLGWQATDYYGDLGWNVCMN